MAINNASTYPGRTESDSSYPYGKAKNQVTPGTSTGTPLEKAWLNDLWGFMQALLKEGGISPSGTPDTALTSQYWQAIKAHVNVHYTSRAALLANTTAQYAAGQVIDMLGVKWAVLGSATANGIDILTLPDGKYAQYTPEGNICYAAALGYSGSNTGAQNAAIIARGFELATTVALPSGMAATCNAIPMLDGWSLVSDNPGVKSQINAANIQPVGDVITLCDLILNSAPAAGAIQPAGDCAGFVARNVIISNGEAAIVGAAYALKNWYLENVTLDENTAGITGTGWTGLITQNLYLNHSTPGAAVGISALITGGLLQGNIRNAGITLATGSDVTLMLQRIEASSASSLLNTAGTCKVLIATKPTLVGTVSYTFTSSAPSGYFDTVGGYRVSGEGTKGLTIRSLAGDIVLTSADDLNAYVTDDVLIQAGGDISLESPAITLNGTSAGVGVGGGLTLTSGNLRLATEGVPASASAAGSQGTVAFSTAYLYVCVAANTWKRTALDTWT